MVLLSETTHKGHLAAVKMQFARTIESRLKWFGFFLALMQGVSAWAAPLSEFPFKLRAGLIWVQVKSPHSARPLSFILDSGAEASVINLQTAQRLDLGVGQPVTVRGINATSAAFPLSAAAPAPLCPHPLCGRFSIPGPGKFRHGCLCRTFAVAVNETMLAARCGHGQLMKPYRG